ncbi:MAG: M28 family metallopeptidase [Bacteroidetes bacterium]|nr:M28 family metallopeptidase [Rhodothermia bacterium]MCS7155667.1 M28 family metallopeptidase [Bacteroidota bacterium]MCX7906526.1 M28 family metallopeptidase [Bacteroidota bacterium]MDW8137193.1 M28 family metallopeptidase [Bacteroidota bacterium]MDW8284937.1 M28 family metallopeptidase [Bacteroidota bacterium]
MRTRLALVLLGALVGSAGAQGLPSASEVGHELLRYVRALEGKSGAERRQVILSYLKSWAVPYRLQPFDTVLARTSDTLRGVNVIVSMGPAKRPAWIVGAHYDAAAGSPGANDNATGVAVLLGLIRFFHGRPLQEPIAFHFYDLEEQGLLGSAHYVRSAERGEIRAMLNLDVVGEGEEIYVGPVGGGDDDWILPRLRRAVQGELFPLRERAFYPHSDHASFARAGLENLSLSIVPRGDADRLAAWAQGRRSGASPRVLRRLHRASDRSAHLRSEALGTAWRVVAKALWMWTTSAGRPDLE